MSACTNEFALLQVKAFAVSYWLHCSSVGIHLFSDAEHTSSHAHRGLACESSTSMASTAVASIEKVAGHPTYRRLGEAFRGLGRADLCLKVFKLATAVATTVEPLYNGHHWDQNFWPL